MAMEIPSMHQTDAQSLEDLMCLFNSRISLLQQLLVIRSATSSSNNADLAPLDIAVRAIEDQLRALKAHLKEEVDVFPKAKAFIDLSLQQEQRLKSISGNLSAHLPGEEHVLLSEPTLNTNGYRNLGSELEHHFAGNGPPYCYSSNSSGLEPNNGVAPLKYTENASQKKKGRSPPPRWYITSNELDSLSSYMRGRLTLEKMNTAVDEMASFAEINARLLAAPRKKLGEDLLEKALELRDLSASEAVKGKHFFLESDMKGPVLKMDNTGKAILTVLRHLGRISDIREGGHRAFVLSKA